jgi:hypothetical protein
LSAAFVSLGGARRLGDTLVWHAMIAAALFSQFETLSGFPDENSGLVNGLSEKFQQWI